MVLFATGFAASAQAEENCSFKFTSAQVDQDLFLEPFPGVNEDRDYTMGLFVRFNSCRKGSSWFSGHEVQHLVLDALSIGDGETQFRYSTAFESLTFTPDDLTAEDPIFEDRPYSSILQVTNNLVAFKNPERSATEVSLSLGFLGLPVSDWVQSGLHQVFRTAFGSEEPFDPEGWDNQISDGGEPTAKLSLTWFHRQNVSADWVDIIYSAGANLGYQTGANVGLSARFGRVNKAKPVWQTDRAGGYLTKKSLEDEFYAIVTNKINFVGYNALLQGQFRSNPHDLSSSQIQRFVFENSIGIGWQNDKSDWLFSCTRRTSEFDLPERRTHFFCGLNFARSL
ncbi:lipid A-modifier LpxR family protein [Kordiimonas sp. SCSIO 12610]|uniref:lipid A-modifier LpxR family protein n=1 Tax=Kordiimonas sp. SCSIO 12610 TaxID=2829597 RepID=UPI002108CC61|nr:lipid A-modifier LpxR family protein [Kordiimonas sp. SCSIO 12610]UTW56490.1 lipid A deacylase LpxR family protein [Kordiimonas sp. SCSIO 12610]